jgi:hypothetical protein
MQTYGVFVPELRRLNDDKHYFTHNMTLQHNNNWDRILKADNDPLLPYPSHFHRHPSVLYELTN